MLTSHPVLSDMIDNEAAKLVVAFPALRNLTLEMVAHLEEFEEAIFCYGLKACKLCNLFAIPPLPLYSAVKVEKVLFLEAQLYSPLFEDEDDIYLTPNEADISVTPDSEITYRAIPSAHEYSWYGLELKTVSIGSDVLDENDDQPEAVDGLGEAGALWLYGHVHEEDVDEDH